MDARTSGGIAWLLALAAASPGAADERDDLAGGIEAYRGADFARAIQLLEPLGDVASLDEADRARALGYLGLSLLATGDRQRASAPLRRLAVLAPGVRLGAEELAPEYRAFFDGVRREVLSTVRLIDRTVPAGRAGRVRFSATLDDPLGVVSRVEARTGPRRIALAATDLGTSGARVLAADAEATPGSYRIVALARDRTEVAHTGDRPIPGATSPVQRPGPIEEEPSHAWLWAAVGAAAAVAVAVVAIVVVLVTTSSEPADACGTLGCLRF
ncbi:MAG: hypothetical protein HYY06_22845 [Deltaproteobacteria bacterium]|nr:hypothetical protein [Deltaproteobacteria bacterium]